MLDHSRLVPVIVFNAGSSNTSTGAAYDDKAPLWMYVKKIQKLESGGSYRWQYNICKLFYNEHFVWTLAHDVLFVMNDEFMMFNILFLNYLYIILFAFSSRIVFYSNLKFVVFPYPIVSFPRIRFHAS